jgi:Flp pilus assembly pilin Flp
MGGRHNGRPFSLCVFNYLSVRQSPLQQSLPTIQAGHCRLQWKRYAGTDPSGVSTMLSTLHRLLTDDRAATAIEYSLLVLLIATVTVGTLTTLGGKVLNMLGPAANAL